MDIKITSVENGFIVNDSPHDVLGGIYLYTDAGEMFAHIYRSLPGTVISNRHAVLAELVRNLLKEEPG